MPEPTDMLDPTAVRSPTLLPVGAERALKQLSTARAEAKPCAPVRDLLPEADIDAAYAVQSAWVAGQVAARARIVGHKIGLTNPAVQAQLGVSQPDFGILLDSMACPAGEPVDITRTLQPKIEAEIAFILARDLDADGIGPAEVAAATGYVVAALEIVDSRIANWDIGIVDTIADNASSGLFVLGDRQRNLGNPGDLGNPGNLSDLGDLDLRACTMTLRRDGEEVSTGSGAACLGDPLAAVAWLARTTRAYGAPLRAGDVVLSGALGPMVPVRPGDGFHTEISGIGEVSVSFTRGTR
jgi:2-keto-4-pentenoate hydratase